MQKAVGASADVNKVQINTVAVFFPHENQKYLFTNIHSEIPQQVLAKSKFAEKDKMC